jgi:hypothetical protein
MNANKLKQLSLVATVAAVLALPGVSAAQATLSGRADEPYAKNLLLFNAGDLLNGTVTVEYERAITSWFGLTGGLSVLAYRGAFSNDGASVLALGPEIGFRLHAIKAAPGGLWLGPYLAGMYISSRDSSVAVRNWGYNLGAAAGYNFILGKSFTLSLGAGGGLTDYGDRVAWAPRLRVGLGGVF